MGARGPRQVPEAGGAERGGAGRGGEASRPEAAGRGRSRVPRGAPAAGGPPLARGALPLSLGSAAARSYAGRSGAGRVTVTSERRSRHLPPAPQSPSGGRVLPYPTLGAQRLGAEGAGTSALTAG